MARTAGDRNRPDRFGIPWRLIIAPALVVAGAVGFLLYIAAGVDSVTGNIDRDADRWQIAYWKKPIPAQGQAPATHLEQARGIHPENCGACHAAQYRDWRKSVHSLAMGPGVTGQFPTLSFAEEAQCLECHAPMSEQWGKLRDDQGNWLDNGAFDGALQAKGMVCSACHLRKHKRHGPPLPQGRASVSQLVHGEPLRTPFFRASEFCKGCHQHPTTTLMINGKTVENTYQEWLSSPYPRRGITCQVCHMPGGRHLWKGIHDAEMARSGVSFSAALTSGKLAAGERIEAELSLTNSGTGHAFPTYTTPAVFLKAAFLDESGAILGGGYYEERIIQRRLDMSTSPWGERFDTRILPGESAKLTFSRKVPAGADVLYLWVWVEPDHFYSGFYRAYLAGKGDFAEAAQLREALKNSLDSHYLLFSRSFPVQREGAAAPARKAAGA